MADPLKIERDRTAVLIEDYQYDIVGRYSTEEVGLLERAASVLYGARQAGIPIIYVVHRFREGYPEVPLGLRERYGGRFIEGTPGAEIHPKVAPQPGEVIVAKRRTAPFSTSDIVAILNAMGATTLVVMGVATSGCVLSTVRWAADINYRLMVVSDCCVDPDPEVHRVLTEKIFPRSGRVVTSDEFLAALKETT